MNNYYIKKAFIVIALYICSIPSFGQTVSFNELNDYIQNVRIGLVDEFFDRFNGKTTHPDIPSSKPDSRSKNLMMLFDLSRFSSKNDAGFIDAQAMMKIVKDDSISINYSDSTWAALAHCKGTLNGKSVKFDLYLTVQHRKGKMYKWVISKADGNLFETTPRNVNDKIMLLPDDHETNFLSLKRMTSEQPFNISQFMVNGFEYDTTSAFVYLVYSKLLKIDYVDDLEFIFTQVPGYIFHVKYFEREKNNAGWLISNFYESSEENKRLFIQILKPAYDIPSECYSVAKEEKKSEDIVEEGSSPRDVQTLRDMYEKRLNEKLLLVQDYISFMQKNDSVRSKSVYMSKMENLFVQESKVIIHKGKKTESLSVKDFCENIINKKYKSIKLDSIQVPIWKDELANLDLSIYKVEVESLVRPFNAHKDKISMGKSLFVYKEDTEDGYEWLPLLGDLTLTVK